MPAHLIKHEHIFHKPPLTAGYACKCTHTHTRTHTHTKCTSTNTLPTHPSHIPHTVPAQSAPTTERSAFFSFCSACLLLCSSSLQPFDSSSAARSLPCSCMTVASPALPGGALSASSRACFTLICGVCDCVCMSMCW